MTEESNWTVKSVDGVEQTTQEKEKEVLEVAAATGDIPVEAVPNTDETIKVDLDAPLKEVAEEETIEEIEDEGSKDELIEPEPAGEQPEPEQLEEPANDGPLERIDEVAPERGVHEVQDEPATQTLREEVPQRVLPENVDKLIQFMEETGGSVEDYINLNKDIKDLDDVDVLKDYYKKKRPHLDDDDVSFMMDEKFLFDEELDDDRSIRAKKLAFKEELYDARNFLTSEKDKYYADLKLSPKSNISPEHTEAFEFYNSHKEQVKQQTKLVEQFQDSTGKLFNDEFKGFDFKVGESKYRYKVQDAQKVKSHQSDLTNIVGKYLTDTGELKDAAGYHKAMFAAENADKIAQHFYEQGRADAIRTSAKKAKNIDMNPRSDSQGATEPKTKWSVVQPTTSGEFKVPKRK